MYIPVLPFHNPSPLSHPVDGVLGKSLHDPALILFPVEVLTLAHNVYGD